MAEVAAVVLAGGTSRRFGSDKLEAPYAGRTVLDALLLSLPEDWTVVCVGPERATARPVRWTREDPAGGGPLAGVAAGAADLDPRVEVVVVLAGDLPAAGPAARRLVAALLTAEPGTDAVAGTDAEGFANPLLAAYRAPSLLAALPEDPRDRAARTLLRATAYATEPLVGLEGLDVDTPEDLGRHG